MRRADELEDDVRTAAVRGLEHGVGKAGVLDRLAAELAHELRGGVAAHGPEHARAGDDADLNGRAADAAGRAVHEQHVARRERRLTADGIVRRDEGLGHRGGRGLVEGVGHRGHAAVVHDDAVGQAASADEAEHAIAGLPAQHVRSAGLDRARDLEARHVLRAAGRRGIRAVALREVGRVDARVRDAHEQLLAPGHRIGTLLEPDDLVPAATCEHHCAHVCSLAVDLRVSLEVPPARAQTPALPRVRALRA